MNEELFQKNLDMWSQSHPKEAIWMQYVDCKHTEIVEIGKGKPNLRKNIEGNEYYLYPKTDREKKMTSWRETVNLEGIDVLYIYGVGLGLHFDLFQDWLNESEEHSLVFLEDDIEVIYCFFETTKASEILSNPKVHLYYLKDVSDAKVMFSKLYWQFAQQTLGFCALPIYEKTKFETFNDIKHQITYDSNINNCLLKEYLLGGATFFSNFYSNILQINKASLGNALFGKFKDIPAVICGAGPSLNKNKELLKDIGDKAIIFAGSSSLNALVNSDILPTLGAGLDPNPMQAERIGALESTNFPYLYRNRIFPEALKLVKGPKLYITGAGGYKVSDWFEKEFDIHQEEIEEGHNVINFCLEVAHKMGCNPIIFAGMDLSYTGMQAYSSGVVEDPSVSQEKLKDADDFDKEAFIRKDIFGNDVYTLWKWISEAKWIGDFAELHPNIKLINATEGGIGFPGIQNEKLEDVIRKYFTTSHDISGELRSVIKKNSLSHISDETIIKTMQKLRSSFERCLSLIETLIEENDKLLKKIEDGEIVEQTQTGEGALAETELGEEPAYVYVLDIFNDAATKSMTRDLMKIFDNLSKFKGVEKVRQTILLNQKKDRFLCVVTKGNLDLIQRTLSSFSRPG